MKSIFIILAVLSAVFSSLVPIPGTDVWFSQFIFVMLFGFLLIAGKIYDFHKAIGILYIYFCYSTFFVAKADMVSVISLLMTGLCLLMAKEVSKVTEKQAWNIWHVLFFILVIQVILGIVQMLNMDPFFHKAQFIGAGKFIDMSGSDVVGFSGSHNQYGLNLSALAPSAIFIFWPMVIPILACLIAIKSCSGLLSLFVSGAFLAYMNGKKSLFLLAIILILGSVIFSLQKVDAFKERIDIWKLTISQVVSGKMFIQINENIKMVKTSNPLFGYGFGEFMKLSPGSQESAIDVCKRKVIPFKDAAKYEHAHNDLVETIFDTGFIGFFIVLFSIGWIIRDFMVSNKSKLVLVSAAALLAYFINSLTVYTVHTATSGFYLAVILGLFYNGVRNGQRTV